MCLSAISGAYEHMLLAYRWLKSIQGLNVWTRSEIGFRLHENGTKSDRFRSSNRYERSEIVPVASKYPQDISMNVTCTTGRFFAAVFIFSAPRTQFLKEAKLSKYYSPSVLDSTGNAELKINRTIQLAITLNLKDSWLTNFKRKFQTLNNLSENRQTTPKL